MISVLVISLCCVTAGALSIVPPYVRQYQYSFSPSVGRGNGNSFATEGEGAITGVKVWESSSAYIRGLQLQFNGKWAAIHGRSLNEEHEFLLFDNEAIVQILGKANPSNFIYQLMFVTNRGRIFMVGQPVGTSFNHSPTYWGSELMKISGRADGNGITAIAAHWGSQAPVVFPFERLSSSDAATPENA
ncbi:hypothetical protein GJAV_G00017370 [Gymnothorax javanicus]|nr:hypothetical protein GJAV_G00017370 [Gymnothorax javanicus]